MHRPGRLSDNACYMNANGIGGQMVSNRKMVNMTEPCNTQADKAADETAGMPMMPLRRTRLRDNSIYLLPNAFTLAALFAAFFAITQSMHDRYEAAAIAVFISMLLDGMDGRVARWTNSQSAFGEQLDSLADMVSFGVAPALIAYKWQLFHFGKIGYSVAFIYCACAALRLALFNTLIGKISKKWFIGIPSPTAAALVIGLIWVDHSFESLPHVGLLCLLITLFGGLSMVVQIPFWSFKEINVRRKVPFFVMILAVMGLLVVTWQPSVVLFAFFLIYSLSGYVMFAWRLVQRHKKSVAEASHHDSIP